MLKARQKARRENRPSTETIPPIRLPASPPPDALYLRALFLVCAFVVFVAGSLYLTFLDRELYFDEVGLYNPAYMFQHYARIIYPMHGQFDGILVHPPTHYLVIGAFLRLGLTLPHAAAVEPVTLLATACLLLVFSRFSLSIKFGLLFGTFLGALIWNVILTVRPDLSLALAWIAGLIALESARLSDWQPWRLAMGSLLLVYASALHYPGVLAQAGILVYAVWACFVLPRRRLPATIGALLAGPCLIGIPYLLLFAVPFRNQIWSTIQSEQGPGGPMIALRHHLETYDIWAHGWSGMVQHQPLVQSLLFPLWSLHIPVALIGPLLLFAFRSTRALAIAALPQVLFIVFGARYKQPGYSGYYAPEVILYLSAVIAVFFAGVLYVVSRIKASALSLAAAVLVVAGFTVLALHDKPRVVTEVKFTRDLRDLDVGRAASRAILGPSAFVTTTGAGVWYTSGAEHLYPVFWDLAHPPAIAEATFRQYFLQFDAVVLDADQGWVAWNKERENLTSFLASGDLNLMGFWFGDRRQKSASGLSLLMLTPNEEPVRGFASNRGKTYRFEPAPQADSVLFCAVCPIGDLQNRGEFDFYATFFLPSKNNHDDPRSITDPADPRSVIRVLLVSQQKFQQDVLPHATRCKTRYQIPGRLVEVDENAMVSQLRRTDRPIKFYRSIAAALAGAGRLNAGNTDKIPGAIQLDKIQPASAETGLSKTPDGWQLTTQPALGAAAAAIPIENVNGVSGGYLYVRAKESEGAVGFSLLNSRTSVPAAPEVPWEAHDPVNEIYIPVRSFDGVDRLVIRNLYGHVASKILIKDLAVVTVRPPSGSAANR